MSTKIDQLDNGSSVLLVSSQKMDSQINSYFERKNIPQLLESLVTGLSYARPEDPVAYLKECLSQVNSNSGPLKWDSFIDKNSVKGGATAKQSPATTNTLNQSAVLAAEKLGQHQHEQLQAHVSKSVGKNEKTASPAPAPAAASNATESVQPTIDKTINAVFVLGGPGSGKGTQCERLVSEFGWSHVSVGDLLRKEVQNQTEVGKQIDSIMKEGQIVPLNIVLNALQNALKEMPQDKGILIDGFPRETQQAVEFEKSIGKVRFALFFECSEAVMEQRLLKRAETSGRADDNIETIKKRFKTFVEQSLPVTEYFSKENRLVRISAEQSPEEVYQQARSHFAQ